MYHFKGTLYCFPSGCTGTSNYSSTSASRGGYHRCEETIKRYRVEGALRWLKDNNSAYSNIAIDVAHIHNLPEDGELPNLRTIEFSKTACG